MSDVDLIEAVSVLRDEVVAHLGDRFLICSVPEVSALPAAVATLPSRVPVRAPEKRRPTEE